MGRWVGMSVQWCKVDSVVLSFAVTFLVVLEHTAYFIFRPFQL